MGIPERLKSQTSEMAQIFVSRMLNLRGRDDLKPCFRCPPPAVHIQDIIEPGVHSAVGIDGSMEYDELLEMLLFYACATGFRCNFTFGDGRVKFNLKEVWRDSRLEASASVPLWMEDVSSVTGDVGSSEKELIWSAEKVPFAIMTMAELYLALKASEDPGVKVVFLDRPLHGTFSPLARDVRTILKNKRSALLSLETSHGRPSLLDLGLVLVIGCGGGAFTIPSRRRYLPYMLVKILLENDEIRASDLARRLGLEDVTRLGRVVSWLVEKTGEEFLDGDLHGTIRLKPRIKNFWPRMKELALNVVEHVFFSPKHPLILGKGEDWLTVWDLNAVNLILIQMLRERSRDVLFIGIAKDTTASDFITCVVPYAMASGLVKGGGSLPAIRHDRAFLTILSGANPDTCSAPWRTISYDACFTSMVYSGKLGAARKRVAMEQQFVKAYFQLREFQGDRELRSPTFLYDRFFNPEFDSEFVGDLKVMEGDSEVTVSPYWEGERSNPLDDLIMALLSASDNPEVLEVMGHNQLLYLADKAVKTEIKLMKDLLRSVAELELGPLSRKYKLFTIARRFRDIRSEMERSRSRSGAPPAPGTTGSGADRLGGF
ncbi:MAG: hypothetical protein NO482_07715 [Candidatus Methanomethylicia archaeon]|nr:hypothetical protein [Candidatus Methanomethylicia archaeon]